MFDELEMFRLSGALASHAGLRSETAARNVAQADTPGYRALRVGAFDALMAGASDASVMRATRPGHLGGAAEAFATREAEAAVLPNGNSVSMEAEMADAARARMDHDMALSVYRSGLTLLRASLSRS